MMLALSQFGSQSDVDCFVARFVLQMFPLAVGAIFFGSRSRGEETIKSDFDIFVILDSVKCPYRQHLHVGKWLFDVCVFDIASARVLCDLQRKRRNDYFEAVFRFGRVVKDDKKLIKKFQEELATIELIAPGGSEFKPYRLSLTCLIADVVGRRNEYEYMTSCTELYQCILRSKYLVCRGKEGMLVYLTKFFLKDDEVFATLMYEAFVNAVHGNPLKLVALANDVLDLIGGPVADREVFLLNS